MSKNNGMNSSGHKRSKLYENSVAELPKDEDELDDENEDMMSQNKDSDEEAMEFES